MGQLVNLNLYFSVSVNGSLAFSEKQINNNALARRKDRKHEKVLHQL